MGKIGVFLVGSDLSAREEKIVQLLVVGFSNRDIARALDVNVATLNAEMRQLLHKLKDRSETLRSINVQALATH
jgi:DNA-binding NarL/FixJ family response regulator